MMVNTLIQQVTIPIRFPEGVRIGAGKGAGNVLVQARDGQGAFVLPGSALAGALRHALEANAPNDLAHVDKWFGQHRNRPADLSASRIRFVDSRLKIGGSESRGIRVRTHNAIDRHRGAPIDGGLFSTESLPPGTATTLLITIESPPEEADDAKQLLQTIVGLFDEGITLGGSVARGIGRAVLHEQAKWKAWDLTDLDQHAAWLDHQFQMKQQNGQQDFAGEPLSPLATTRKQLSITMDLAVPRGQDFVVADGQGVECDMEPQKIRRADGSTNWLLPGSALRGLFRAYVTRLAAREGQPVADSYQRWKNRNKNPRNVETLKGEDLAFGFVDGDKRDEFLNDPEQVECPVMDLFGSAYRKGRIHIADSLSKKHSKRESQYRVHVAIDRFSGGANEGFLFDNQTLTRGEFTVAITIDDPTEGEARWIAGCILALDMGLIRVGSSKGSGRLALQRPPTAQGPHAELITAINPMEVYHG